MLKSKIITVLALTLSLSACSSADTENSNSANSSRQYLDAITSSDPLSAIPFASPESPAALLPEILDACSSYGDGSATWQGAYLFEEAEVISEDNGVFQMEGSLSKTFHDVILDDGGLVSSFTYGDYESHLDSIKVQSSVVEAQGLQLTTKMLFMDPLYDGTWMVWINAENLVDEDVAMIGGTMLTPDGGQTQFDTSMILRAGRKQNLCIDVSDPKSTSGDLVLEVQADSNPEISELIVPVK
jgi:hypothetical protein